MKYLKQEKQISIKNKKNVLEQSAQENKELLTAIKNKIKNPTLRQEGFTELLEVDSDLLGVENQVYYYYIKGKYYVLEFKATENKDVELLSYGNDCYSDMVTIAYENNFSIENPKRHFSRAHCKYLIAINQPSEQVKEKLFKKATQIIGRVLCYRPDNARCLWLQSELLKA